ncbi:hypothetical protein ACJIZ3_012894 [Penstemon smallii]|uniref:Knottins-like domain-containing protein n=1 Tax=Penstemon smallii TaxID=265156 RepID=A0ABD3UNC9_9LAMI
MFISFYRIDKEKLKLINCWEILIDHAFYREFRGLCIKSDNCASICEKEGYLTGTCKGFLWKCICEKDCKAAGGATSPGGGPPDGGDGGPPDGGAPDGPATSNM